MNQDVRWFQQFQIEPDDRKDQDAVWDDQFDRTRIVRAPTRAEKVSIALIGVFSIGFIVLMVVTLLAAVYISRR